MTVAAKLIVALDVNSAQEARQVVQAIGAEADFYKVGLRLMIRTGPDLIRSLVRSGIDIFLDLKVHEIPSSAAAAARAAGALGVSMLTIHAAGGPRMMAAVAQAAAPYPSLKILAVTTMTSLSDDDLKAAGTAASRCEKEVLRLAEAAMASGCHGIVSSAKEASALRGILPPATVIVTPGIRLHGEQPNDHRRAATPAEALRYGSSHIVVGRPIIGAAAPALAVALYREEMRRAGVGAPVS